MLPSCCTLTAALGTADEGCGNLRGGAQDVRIACLNDIAAYTQVDCRISSITVGVSPAMFWNVNAKQKSESQTFGITYDEASDTITYAETFTLQLSSKDHATVCQLKDLAGQEVVLLWQDKTANRWWCSGIKGGMRLREVAGGTGDTTAYLPTTLTFSSENAEDIQAEVFDTDAATTQALIDSITA